MTSDAVVEILKSLRTEAVTATTVAAVLAYQSPRLVKELFAGISGLLLTMHKLKGKKAGRKDDE